MSEIIGPDKYGRYRVATVEGIPVYMQAVKLDRGMIDLVEGSGKLTCPLCLTSGWEPGQQAKGLLSLYRLFPNVTVHHRCVDYIGGWQKAAEKVTQLYSQYKAARALFIPLGWWEPDRRIRITPEGLKEE